jgi:hypothetical protein
MSDRPYGGKTAVRQILPYGGLVSLAIAACLTAAPARAQTASPQPQASPAAPSEAVPASAAPDVAATPDPAMVTLAKDTLHRLQTNTLDRTKLGDRVSGNLTGDIAAQLSAQLQLLGNPTNFAFAGSQVVDGVTVYEFVATFQTAGNKVQLAEYIGVDASGKIVALKIAPAQ